MNLMNKFLAIVLLLSSSTAFAGYSCVATKWSRGIGKTGYLSGLPTILHSNNDVLGKFSGVTLAKIRLPDATVKYVFNGEIDCRTGICLLHGQVTELVLGKGNNDVSKPSAMYIVSLAGNSETFLPMLEDNVLSIKCKLR